MPNNPKAHPNDPKKFFRERLGDKFEKFVKFSGEKNFVAFFLAKKNAGKGRYSNILMNLTDGNIAHISVGDLYRNAVRMSHEPEGKKELERIFATYYHGKESLERLIKMLQEVDIKTLLPTDLILSLLEDAIAKREGKSIIVDGFPRTLDQVEVALQMKKDFEAKGRPAVFVEINCPDPVLLERQKSRRVCPKCANPKGIKLDLSDSIEYDEQSGEFHLTCNNPQCGGARLIKKQGDDVSFDDLRQRNQLMTDLLKVVRERERDHHIIARNAIPVEEAHASHDMDDFTTSAELSYDKDTRQVQKKFSHWKVKDDEGRDAYSRWPEAVVAEMIEKLSEWIDKLEGKKT